MTRDHLLGWHHHAKLIADSMPASFNPNAPRLVRVPLPENARALDIDPSPRPFFGFDLAAMPEPDQKLGEMARHVQELLQEICGVNGAALIGFKQETPEAAPAAALGDGWIEWHGGECPIEGDETRHEVRFRDSWESGPDENPHGWRWNHFGNYSDIVAYRLLPQEAA